MEILICIVLLVGAIIGFKQGAFKQIANFLGVGLGLLIAATVYERFGDFLASKTGASEDFGNITAFILIVIVVPIALGWLAAFITDFFKKLKLNWVNRAIGAAIGVVSYSIIMSFAFNFFDFIGSNCGFKPQKLSERPAVYYKFKHTTQVIVPNVLIVTDSTEIANGEEPMYGLKPVVDKTIKKTVNSVNPIKEDNE
ncbi:MAG: CvpA family protein [Prevotellaceae bacterium]|nr:CvpA family protein [Candidatus Minthosoma equi]